MASLLDEDFEGAGYENSWSETVGSGNTADEDATAVAQNGSQSFESTLAGTNANAYAEHDIGGNEATTYMIVAMYIDTSSAETDTTDITVAGIKAGAGVMNSNVRVRWTAARGWQCILGYYANGNLTGLSGADDDNLQMTVDTWYWAGIKYDDSTGDWEVRFWNAAQTLLSSASGNNANLRSDSRYPSVGWRGNRNEASKIYLDYFQVDDSGWPAFPSAGGSSIVVLRRRRQ